MSDNVESFICNCPKCNTAGMSVGAMNYKETQQWHKEGDFSASGGAIGTFGFGIGSGGGSYSETGESATKRANVFAEPQRFSIPTGAIIAFTIMAIVGVLGAPTLIGIINSSAQIMNNDSGVSLATSGASNINVDKIASQIIGLLKYIIPLAVIGIIVSSIFKIKYVKEEEYRLNKIIYVKKMKRYNELRYCENCHTLFDSRKNSVNANELGMKEMMEINPLS